MSIGTNVVWLQRIQNSSNHNINVVKGSSSTKVEKGKEGAPDIQVPWENDYITIKKVVGNEEKFVGYLYQGGSNKVYWNVTENSTPASGGKQVFVFPLGAANWGARATLRKGGELTMTNS